MGERSDEIIFDETQHAWSNRFLTVLIACETLTTSLILGVFAYRASGPDRIALTVALFVTLIVLPAVIFSIRLRTRIVGTTLRVWFPPFPGVKIDLTRVTHAEPKRLNPMSDLGGWGYKVTKKHGRVRNMFGEEFVSVTTDDGRLHTIGTQRPQELLVAIRVLAQLPPDESETQALSAL